MNLSIIKIQALFILSDFVKSSWHNIDVRPKLDVDYFDSPTKINDII